MSEQGAGKTTPEEGGLFQKGERLYVRWREGTQPPGTTCPVVIVWEDGGGEYVDTTGGEFQRTRLRRDRRGRRLPVYEEVPRG